MSIKWPTVKQKQLNFSITNLLGKNFEFSEIDNLVEVKVEIKQKELDKVIENIIYA